MSSFAFIGRDGVLSGMLADVLGQHLVVETDGVLASQVIVQFTALRLDDVGLTGLSGVLQVVDIALTFLLEEALVIPGGNLMINQASGGTDVFFHLIIGF